ncbi:response regulator [Aerococcaceae bacterium DSM 111020]|nr:response regulator [Aerococcaceae bacterium DSM 111020]
MDISYLKQKRILLVDDEPELLDMVASILKEYDFENIQTAQKAKEAVSVAKEYSPELAILDVMLPDGDDFSLMKILKEQKDYPILFLTAKGEDENKLEGLGL